MASSTPKSRAAAFEQWSQGGGSPEAEWVITRAEASYFIGTLRGEIEKLQREVRVVRSLLEAHRDPRPIRDRV